MVEVFMTLLLVLWIGIPVLCVYLVWKLLKRSWEAGRNTRRWLRRTLKGNSKD